MLLLLDVKFARLMKASQASIVLAFLSLFVTSSFANAAVDALDILQRERKSTIAKLEKSVDLDPAVKDRLIKDVSSLDREIARWQKSPQQPMLGGGHPRTTKSSRESTVMNSQVGKLEHSISTQVLAVNNSPANPSKQQQSFAFQKTLGILEFP